MSRFAKRSAWAGAVAVLATTLALSVPFLSPAGAASAPSAGTVSASRHAAAKAALTKVIAALSVKHGARTAPRSTPLPYTDVTLLLRDLRNALPSLTPEERTKANAYLARPSDGVSTSCTGNVIATAHFCVHYTPPGIIPGLNPNEATAAQAQLTANTFETVYAKEITGLGYRAPLNDGDGLLDVYLEELGNQGIYGYCDTDGASPDGYTSPAYCAVDNDFASSEFGAPPINSLRVTAAHEFFHAVQFAYNAQQDSWFMEGTAVWMEDIVYPTINDYLQYLPLSQVVKPREFLDDNATLAKYGTVVFWKFLSERYKDNNIIKQVWQAAVPATHRDGIQAVGAVLKARGYSFAPAFAQYGVWNTLPPGTYGDRALWPSPGAWAITTLSKKSHDTGIKSVHLNHLGNAPLIVRPGAQLPTRSKLRVLVDAPNTSHGSGASLEVRFKNGKVTTYTLKLNSAGNGAKLVGFNPNYVKSAIVVLTNGSIGYNDQVFKVRVRAVF